MTFRYNFKDQYEKKSIVMGKFFFRLGISPNTLTLLSLLSSIITMITLTKGWFILGSIGICLVGFWDIADGATARASGISTCFGTVLDHVTDRYTEFIIFSGVIFSAKITPMWVIFAISGMIMASYVRAKAESAGGLEECTIGIVGRTEKLTLLIIGLITESVTSQTLGLKISLILIGALSHITAFIRLAYAYKKITVSNSFHKKG